MGGGKKAWKSREFDGARWKTKGHGSSGESPGKLRPYKSGHRGLGALDGARKRRCLSKVHPEVLDERRQSAEKKDHFVASTKRWLESQGKKATRARRSPETLKTPMAQQSQPSSRDEESQWVAVEDRRRRRVAFEETARDVPGYLENSEDLNVSFTELQEQLRLSEEENKRYASPAGPDGSRS